MKKTVFSLLGILLLAACSKDKFKTVPQVEINSFGPGEVNKGQTIRFRATVTDKEGDLQDTIYLIPKRFNGNTQLSVDTLPFSIKNFGFPERDEIEIEALFTYGELVEGTIFQNLEIADRNFAVGLIVKDKANNKSEYKESDKIVLKKL